MTEPVETTQEPAPPEPAPADRPEKLVIVRYGRLAHVGLFRHDLDKPPKLGQMLVLHTERGTELGKVLINVTNQDDLACMCIKRQSLDAFIQANGADYPFTRGGRVLRPANAQDVNDQAHLDKSGGEELTYARQQIAALRVEMRLVAVEHVLGGERIIFYFTAEQRVDFRELVKRMAGQYHTRIEMRQVGARDEARLVADYERCGQRCCCQEYLKFLKPVSMRMAKVQKATLDPAKISGRCGRLMCCLRYEDETYEQLQSRLPRKNTWVKTADNVVGKVIDMQVLTQLVRLYLPDGSQVVVPNDSIVERGVPEPPPTPPPPVRNQPVRPPKPMAKRDAQVSLADYNPGDPVTGHIFRPADSVAGVSPAEGAIGERNSDGGRTPTDAQSAGGPGTDEHAVEEESSADNDTPAESEAAGETPATQFTGCGGCGGCGLHGQTILPEQPGETTAERGDGVATPEDEPSAGGIDQEAPTPRVGGQSADDQNDANQDGHVDDQGQTGGPGPLGQGQPGQQGQRQGQQGQGYEGRRRGRRGGRGGSGRQPGQQPSGAPGGDGSNAGQQFQRGGQGQAQGGQQQIGQPGQQMGQGGGHRRRRRRRHGGQGGGQPGGQGGPPRDGGGSPPLSAP